jgi:hypothetical protein
MNAHEADPDPYLSLLSSELEKLEGESALLDEEAQRIHGRIGAISKEREVLNAAMRHYRDFLSTRGGAEEERRNSRSISQPKVDYIPPVAKIVLRSGTKRKQILEDILTEAHGTTADEITSRTGFPINVVRNVIWADQKLQLLVRDGDRIIMTERGYELMRRHGVTPSRPASESPQGDPGFGQPRSGINDQESVEAADTARKEGGI